MTLPQFQEQFGTEEACEAHLRRMRWGESEKERCCPRCGSYKTYKYADGVLYKCGDCRRQFSLKTGTVFHQSQVPLTKWYLAIFLAGSLKQGISSVQLAKFLGTKQHTAWYMLHRLRAMLEQDGHSTLLSGTVEVDETYYGKRGRTLRASTASLSTIFGMLQRDGHVVALHVRSPGARVLLPLLERHIASGSTIYSDQARVYQSLRRRGYIMSR